jgi:hypothetical protein
LDLAGQQVFIGGFLKDEMPDFSDQPGRKASCGIVLKISESAPAKHVDSNGNFL